jgi:environmental stress-induced protein Ves
MRHLHAGDYRVMQWKNGGGSTTELAIFPEDSGLSGHPFLWRVSIAEVVADGPFSRFPGYDRHIMVIAGAGMMLDAEDQGEIDLSVPFRPMRFSGDLAVHGRLNRGPVRDFNLMVARSFGQSELTAQDLVARKAFLPDGSIRLIHLLEGEVTANGHVVASGDTIVIDGNEAVEVKPLGQSARLAVCRISPL